MGKYTITTLGCKVNQSESDMLARTLRQSGWVPASENESADICIINTCTVTARASMQSRQESRKAIRTHPGARIVVTGCYARTEPDALRKIRGVHDIVNLKEKSDITYLLSDRSRQIRSLIAPERKYKEQCTIQSEKNPGGIRARPFVKVQDGCNGHCTYCIVPSARGESRSSHPESIMEQIRLFAKEGYQEVVLTGIHMGAYGLDLTPRVSLSWLLSKISREKPMPRIRLSSIEPRELCEEIIGLVADSGCFCPHFHVPLQSGDDGILKKMGRPYGRNFFRDMILDIHQRIPDAAIGTDVLIGFPGESDAAFENTLALIKELPFSYLHVFPFSARNGTPAAGYPDQIPRHRIKERSQKIRELGNIKKNAFYSRFLHKHLEIVVEGKGAGAPGYLKGTTSNYIPVFVRGEHRLKHSLVEVAIDGVDKKNRVFGTIC